MLQAVALKLLAVQVVAELVLVAELAQVADQAAALKWLLVILVARLQDAPVVVARALVADQAAALKSLLAILAELHPATADVA